MAASLAPSSADLAGLRDIRPALLTAAGVSDKAARHMRPEDKEAAVQGLIKNFLVPAGANFVEELVFRFLLTRGDTLGGSMRNFGGVLAQRTLTRAIIANLALGRVGYLWRPPAGRAWMPRPDDDSDIELHVCGLSWTKGRRRRTVVFNQTVPFLKNNVDLCLLDGGPEELGANIRSASAYLALGELKGGIDPAGADEHWKTASKALTRIREAFAASGLTPHTFFVGAAIAKKMAQEIWDELEFGTLENAANLTQETQVMSLTRWLCQL